MYLQHFRATFTFNNKGGLEGGRGGRDREEEEKEEEEVEGGGGTGRGREDRKRGREGVGRLGGRGRRQQLYLKSKVVNGHPGRECGRGRGH